MNLLQKGKIQGLKKIITTLRRMANSLPELACSNVVQAVTELSYAVDRLREEYRR